ncbi:MAG TPA: TrmH family RNA methyltransferase [Saprospiraceae bacterium]|nr:TrmH family RNA methyltransferase [Saprospiraceae bacterium]
MGKFRQKYNKFIVEGQKSCLEFLRSSKFLVHTVLAYGDWLDQHQNWVSRAQKTYVIDHNQMANITQLKTPSPVLLVCEVPDSPEIEILHSKTKHVYLDDVQDPGNVGTIIRVCDWFGIEGVIRSEKSADFYNPKVVQSSMGSLCNVLLATLPPDQLLSGFPFHTKIAAIPEGTPVDQIKFPEKHIIIIGNESKGINEILLSQSTIKVGIPGNTFRIADSLNAAISAAILCNYSYSSSINL